MNPLLSVFPTVPAPLSTTAPTLVPLDGGTLPSPHHPHGALALLLIAAVSIGLLLVMIIRLKVPAFLSLLAVSVVVAIASGLGLGDIFTVVTSGVGATMGKVALLIGFGAVLGSLIEASGGVQSLADKVTSMMGPTRVALALMAVAFIVAIPVFFEVGVIVMIPIIYAFSKIAGFHPIKYGLPMCGIMLAIHVACPPHPGVVAGAGVLGADLGLLTIIALTIAVLLTPLALYTARRLTAGRAFSLAPDVQDQLEKLTNPHTITSDSVSGQVRRPAPSAGLIAALVFFPIVMVMVGTIGGLALRDDHPLHGFMTLLGTPAFALLVAVITAFFAIKKACGWSMDEAADIVEKGLPPIGSILMVVAAGGVFGAVLGASGIGKALANTLDHLGVPLILLAFVISLVLRAAQGSATVAIVTTAGLLSSTITGGHYSSLQIALLTVAIGFGALGLSHVTDAGFWVVTKYLGLSVPEGLRTWTVLTTVLGVAGFLLTWAAWGIVALTS